MPRFYLHSIWACALVVACSANDTEDDAAAEGRLTTDDTGGAARCAELAHAGAASSELEGAQALPDGYGTKTRVATCAQRADLALLTLEYWSFDAKVEKGQLLVHKNLAGEVKAIFCELLARRFPIKSLRLVDRYYDAYFEKSGGVTRSEYLGWLAQEPVEYLDPACVKGDIKSCKGVIPVSMSADNESMLDDNTSAMNCRVMAALGDPAPKKLSLHALGAAIDLNPLDNPMADYADQAGNTIPGLKQCCAFGKDSPEQHGVCKLAPGAAPASIIGATYTLAGASYACAERTLEPATAENPSIARPYSVRTSAQPHYVDSVVDVFKKYGWSWGGDWNGTPDYQHFQKRPKNTDPVTGACLGECAF